MMFTATSKILAAVVKLLPPQALDVFIAAANESLAAGLEHNDCMKAGWAAVREGWQRPTIGKRWVRKEDPGAGDVHVDVPLGGGKTAPPKKKPVQDLGTDNTGATSKLLEMSKFGAAVASGKLRFEVTKFLGSDTRLYANRPLLNAADLQQWAKDQGFAQTMPADAMHVTLAYSKEPFDASDLEPSQDQVTVPSSSEGRTVEALGDKGAVVLRFEDPTLADRWQEIKDAGASWDFPSYKPHVTLTWQNPGVDLDQVEPYSGPLVFGPENFAPINDDWQDNLKEETVKHFDASVCKVDGKLGLVFGFGIICKRNGEPYFDLQDDHIPEDTMLKAATDFMQANRISGDMHARDVDGLPVMDGTVVFAFPLTSDIAKAMGIQSSDTGLMIGIKPSADVLAKFESGEYTGFSIGGYRLEDENVA